MDYNYQTTNFHFKVNFSFDSSETEISFQSVTGLDSTLETEQLKEGGQNHFTHVLPLRRKYGPLNLKRGLVMPSDKAKITAWFKKAFDDMEITPFDLSVTLLNEEHKALMHWKVIHAWPISWKIGELNAEQGVVLIETLEINYNTLIFEKS
jgi:phage tail-like protein